MKYDPRVPNVLANARDALCIPGLWIDGNLAEDETRHEVKVTSPSACHFCMMGAVWAAIDALYHDTNSKDQHTLFLRCRNAIGGTAGCEPEEFNDEMAGEYLEVVELIEDTIHDYNNR